MDSTKVDVSRLEKVEDCPKWKGHMGMVFRFHALTKVVNVIAKVYEILI